MLFNQQDYTKLGIEDLDDADTKVMLSQLQAIIINKLTTQAVMSLDDAAVEELGALADAPDDQIQTWLASKIPNFDQTLEQIKTQTIDGIIARRDDMLNMTSK
jgi:succinate dehydrogenase flavin-adding protein (antitoxin of CptAB toxin-antitoxin module)